MLGGVIHKNNAAMKFILKWMLDRIFVVTKQRRKT